MIKFQLHKGPVARDLLLFFIVNVINEPHLEENLKGFGGMLPLFLFIFTCFEQTYNIYIYYSQSTTLVILIASAR